MIHSNANVGNITIRLTTIALGLIIFTGSGCSVFLGNVRPVTEKSERYTVMDLTQRSSGWSKLSMEAEESEEEAVENDVSDIVYQSTRTASIISLNSACRDRHRSREQNLQKVTNLLLLGLSNVRERDEKTVKVGGANALMTTVHGLLNGVPMMLRTVVLRHDDCIYDIMYVSRPEHFTEEEPDFSAFLSSLRLN